MFYNPGLIVLAISNQPHATHSDDLKSLPDYSLNNNYCTPLSPIAITN